MRSFNSLPLDDDLIDLIMTYSPTFGALQSMILTSKAFHAVYQTHPKSILRQVALNVTGPALPQAIRVLRYSESHLHVLPWAEDDEISLITSAEIHVLVKNAEVVRRLEDLFSLRHKDRTSKSSKLSSMESWRFRRAMYRLMLFSKVVAVGDDLEPEELHDTEIILQARTKRQKFLEEFVMSELVELNSVSLFLVEIAEWSTIAGCDDSNGCKDPAVYAGPAAVLNCYEYGSFDPIIEIFPQYEIDEYDEFLDEILSHPLSQIWNERKVKPPDKESLYWKSILDHVDLNDNACHQCGAVAGLNLWGEPNWDYLRGYSWDLNLGGVAALFKGRLPGNEAEMEVFRECVGYDTDAYSQFMTRLFDLKISAFDSWSKEDWLCEGCVQKFISAHLILYLLDQKRKAGIQIPKDCRYGYDCETQTYLIEHAKRRNHLCEPSHPS